MALYAAYGSNLDPAQMHQRCPHSPVAGTGWLEGWRLTFGGEDLGWEGSLATLVEAPGEHVFVGALRHDRRRRRAARRLGGRRHRALPQAPGAGARRSTASKLAWVYVLDGYEGGLPVGALPRRARRRGGGRRRAGRLRARAAHPALPVLRRLSRRPSGTASAPARRRRPSSETTTATASTVTAPPTTRRRPTDLAGDQRAEQHGDDRVDVGVRRDLRHRRDAEQPGVRREGDERAEDDEVAPARATDAPLTSPSVERLAAQQAGDRQSPTAAADHLQRRS